MKAKKSKVVFSLSIMFSDIMMIPVLLIISVPWFVLVSRDQCPRFAAYFKGNAIRISSHIRTLERSFGSGWDVLDVGRIA